MKYIIKLKIAFSIAVWSWKNPQTLNPSNMKMLSDLLTLILKVAKEDRHMMTHLAYIHPELGEQQIVSVWAGAGVGAEPTKRIKELLEENGKLQALLSRATEKVN